MEETLAGGGEGGCPSLNQWFMRFSLLSHIPLKIYHLGSRGGSKGRENILHRRQTIFLLLLERCCYITVDFETAASQSGFSNYMLYICEKTIVI
jgi:hypothetical protein